MTLQIRPTFSESWYRVKSLRAKLRAGAQISRQFYRGERWYVVRDPAGNQYHRLSDAAYRFVGLLDGSRTVEEAWDLVGGQLEDDAPTQPEVIQIMSHLYSANLIDADVTPDATVLLKRHKQLSKRKMQNRLMNVLFPRIPLWDPDAFIQRWMPLAKVLFSKFGALVWLIVVGTAITMLLPYWDKSGHSLKSAAMHAVDLRYNTINILLLYGVFVLIKFIHELGHAFSCRRFGGECHEMGVMFLVFVPTPYVDASSAWSFPNKWHRFFVGAAGMIVELFFASLMAFVWMRAGDPKSLIAQLAFNSMLIASVTTILFNANPLLRYDGYYMLSDFLEIPNLSQKSNEYALGLIKRHIFRVKLQQPLPPALQRVWLLFYAITSAIYRVFVGVLIILIVAFQVPVLGVLMALGGVVTWIAVPVFKLFKYLAVEPELHRKRGRAVAFSVAVAAIIIGFIGLIPFSFSVDQVAIADAAEHEAVMPQWPGFVRQIRAHDGDMVKAGDVILVTDDPDLDKQIRQERSDVKLYSDQEAADRAINDPAAAEIDHEQWASANGILNELLQQRDALTLRAPISGQLVAPKLNQLMGIRLDHGKEVGTVIDSDRLNIRVLLEQNESQLITSIMDNDAKAKKLRTEIRLTSDIDTVLVGERPHKVGAATTKPPHPGVTTAGGEEYAVDPKDPNKLQSDQFEIDVPLANPDKKYVVGQKAYVRFKLDKRPLGWQWYRRILQIIQTKPTNPLV